MPGVPVGLLCGLFGKTKQGYYKQLSFSADAMVSEAMVLEMVNRLRKRAKTKRWGVRKLHGLLRAEMSAASIKMGRDKLFGLLRENGMLVRPRKRKYFTTQSHHWLRKYENLVENAVVTRPNQVWASDITYVKLAGTVYYLYLITDAYSQYIVGSHISLDLKAPSAVKALRTALKNNKVDKPGGLVHHSDRGIQYCSAEYTAILKERGVLISMTKPGSPQENAIAERVNGILKEEWIYDMELLPGENPRRKIKGVIKTYNEIRPHNTLGNMAPSQVHRGGFPRHETERVMGKTYNWAKQKASLLKGWPKNTSYAIGPCDYSLASCSPAELASASSWHCKYK